MIPSVIARQTRETILDYLKTTFALADRTYETALFNFLNDPDQGLFRGPFVDIRLPFRRVEVGERSPLEIRPPFLPFRHQQKAFERLYSRAGHQPQHTLVTTGTGSGKTECFLYPILDHCWRERGQPGVKAIILYPMNALATDQARRLARILWEDERLKGVVSAGLYVGGEGAHGVADAEHLIDKRDVLRDSPPDILLTNYKMLDFMLLRPEDQRLWAHNGPQTLRYLVLDELHTYDGAQGSDVACLIRRLRSRLRAPAGSICAVGTSATLGGTSEQTITALTDFATKVFDDEFFGDSVILEDRLTPKEALGSSIEFLQLPVDASDDELDASQYDGLLPWIAAQVNLWFPGHAAATDPEALGKLLERHELLHQVLRVLGGRIHTWPELDAGLIKRRPDLSELPTRRRQLLLESFLGLVSRARRRTEGRVGPFLTVQVQFWVRELRQLLQRVGPTPDHTEFAWAASLPTHAVQEAHWLPIAHCRDCGGHGLATVQADGDPTLQTDTSTVGKAWLWRARKSRYLQIGRESGDLFPQYLDPRSMRVTGQAGGQAAGDPLNLPVSLSGDQSQQTPPRFLGRCPDCGADQVLSILGSRAPSLLSVAVSRLFSSDFNEDKKVLAFTDSVQDASHRAGFFGARTYRFNIRTAMQGLLQASPRPVPLSEFGVRMLGHWSALQPAERLLPALLPPDLQGLPGYQRFLETRGAGRHQGLERDLTARLGWEATMEYSFRAVAGRTLQQTRCSTVGLSADQLEAAARDLTLLVTEDNTLAAGGQPVLTEDALRHFLSGLLYRIRMRGGIEHPFLRTYIGKRGGWFFLTKQQQRLISPFGPSSVLPRFPTDFASPTGQRQEIFDSVISPPARSTWFRNWAARSLGIAENHEAINTLYRLAMRVLVKADVLREHQVSGSALAWAIRPESLVVTAEVQALYCEDCGGEVVVPSAEADRWAGQSCIRYRCHGDYRLDTSDGDAYYSRLYRSGRLQRIYSHEHTGLLTRLEREALEEAFKNQDTPAAPNLLVATPTLEMGIDIGDLSAMVLCSVPPAPANFLQRIGRAGRQTGNAFCLTLVNSRPHDLYFNEQPMEMLEGQVLPPGCFLNAPEMLRRQMVAHAMDSWARDDGEAKPIPRKTALVLGETGAAVFPGRFLDYYVRHRQDLTAGFLGRFDRYLSAESRASLEAFGNSAGIPDAIQAAFNRVREELDELRAVRRRIKERLATLPEGQGDPPDGTPSAVTREDLDLAGKITGRLIQELGNKYPLNALTDEGVLPNYAFPEPGVRLESVIRDQDDDGVRRYDTREFIRPASSALRELAPFNTFYAEGRRVVIDEIDVGSRAQPLTEEWRFCPACNHMERVQPDGSVAPECPRCRDPGWPDAGQQQTLVHFRRSRSLTGRLEASAVDDSDDRVEEHYHTLDLVDVAPEHVNGARVIDDLPFGYELLRGVVLREVNFGREERQGNGGLQVAGQQIDEKPFEVCLDCGRVRDESGTVNHAPYCRSRQDNRQEDVRPLLLYREVESEAIRILLPFLDVNVDERRASFRAALELGLRRHFQGDPGHLQMKSVREPISGGGHRQYLVLFDAVPGGTGYLSDLWRDQNFLDVLEQALRALQGCVCQTAQDGGRSAQRDGCYRCLYAYQRQRDLPLISSRLAQETLQQILGHRAELHEARTLSEVPIETRLESELEIKFVTALQRHVEKQTPGAWQEITRRGEVHWAFQLNGRRWELLAQQDLDRRQGVAVASRPDFLLRPVDGDPSVPRVAVFCDGFAYHVQPDKVRSRIWDDVEKREAILESDRFRIWSVTWKDVEAFEREEAGAAGLALLEPVNGQRAHHVGEALGLNLPRTLAHHNSMALLVAYLGQPDAGQWRALACCTLLGWLTDGPWLAYTAVDDAFGSALSNPDMPAESPPHPEQQPPFALGKHRVAGCVAVVARISQHDLGARRFSAAEAVLRLHDIAEQRRTQNFEGVWRGFLQTWNLLQFLENIAVQTTERLLERGAPIERHRDRAAEVHVSNGVASPEIRQLLDLATEAAKPLIAAVAAAGLPLPTFDYELDLGTGTCGPMPDLAWPQWKIAVLDASQIEDRPEFEKRGWTVLVHPVDAEKLPALLRPDRRAAAE